MKKYLIWMLVICLVVSIALMGSGCKEEQVQEEETTEEASEDTTEEVAEEEESTTEEAAEEEEFTLDITDEPVTINMWANAGPETTLFNEAAELYMAERPNVEMIITSQENTFLRGTAPSAVASGQEEMDFFWFWSNLGQSMGKSGLLVDLSMYYENLGWWDKMIETAHKPMVSSDGGSYFFSYGHTAIPLVFYSKNIFDELGAEIPTTLEEMEQIAQDSIAAGYKGITNTRWLFDSAGLVAHFMPDEEKEILGFWSLMTKEEKAENVELWKTNTGYRKAFEWIANSAGNGLYDENINLLTVQEKHTLFVEDQSSMHIVGNWMAILWEVINPDIEFGVFPFPEAKIPRYFGNSLAIPSYVAENNPEKIPIIIEFFDRMLEPEYAKIVTKNVLVSSSKLMTNEDVAEVSTPAAADIVNYMDEVGTESAVHFGFSTPMEIALEDICAQLADGTLTVDEGMEIMYQAALDDLDATE